MALRFGCYGKLPFYREFLRIGADGAAATWIVQWLEAAHSALTRANADGEPSGPLGFAEPASSGRGAVVGVVRQSSDGLRRHPVALFAELPSGALATEWHLAPAALREVWRRLAALLDGSHASPDDLARDLRQLDVAPAVDDARAAYAETLARSWPQGAWAGFTGADEDGARHLAANLLAVAREQAVTRAHAAGVAFQTPVGGIAGARGLAAAACWLDAFRVASKSTVLPSLVWDERAGLLYAFHRPFEGTDLAALLVPHGTPPWDDLAEPWQTLPPDDAADAALLDRITGAGCQTMAAVLAALDAR